MKSSLKIAVPVIAMIAVIFGVTFFSQYTPPSEDESKGTGPSSTDPPLRFFSSTRTWDPPDFRSTFARRYQGLPLLAPSADPAKEDTPFKFSVQDRIFPGYFEVQSDAVGPKNSADFWFENRHTNPVTMQLRWVSCGACSAGWVAPIRADVTRQLIQSSFVSVLPQGLFNGLPLGLAGPAANLHPDRMKWQRHSFLNNPNVVYRVPAAETDDPWSPQWGILKLQFSVGNLGPKIPPLAADFLTTVEGTPISETNRFMIAFEGVPAFELSVPSIDIGEMNENSEPKQFEVIAFSSTRGRGHIGTGDLGDLSVPTARVAMPLAQGGDPGDFVQIGAPVRVEDTDLPFIADQLATRQQKPKRFRVEAAYRFPVTVNPRIGEARIDIGQMERDLYFTLPGVEQKVALRGMVTGVVWLDNNQHDIELPRFDVSKGYVKDFNLITARTNAVVTVLNDQCRPRYLQVSLEKNPKPPAGDRGYYVLRLKIPPSAENPMVKPGTWSGEIVLEVKGASMQRIRIPVRGRIDPR